MLVHHTDHRGGASVVKAIFVHITHNTQTRSPTSVFVFSCILFYTHPVISEELNMCWIMKSLLQTLRSITRLEVLNYICSHYWSWAFPHIHQNFETNKEKRRRQKRRRPGAWSVNPLSSFACCFSEFAGGFWISALFCPSSLDRCIDCGVTAQKAGEVTGVRQEVNCVCAQRWTASKGQKSKQRRENSQRGHTSTEVAHLLLLK